ncbi:MAG TPA: DinB family protein [Blastocatellia bacterium]|jgi:hypothetical protein
MSSAKRAREAASRNPYHSYIEGKDPMRVLASTYTRLMKLTAGLTPRQLGRRVIPGKWSIHEIIAHLADVELVHAARSRWMKFEEDPPLPAFDQEAWTRGWSREKESFAETLERFGALRRAQLRLFRNSTPADLNRPGRHSERGTEYLSDYIAKSAGHDLNHLGQIEQLRKLLLAEK